MVHEKTQLRSPRVLEKSFNRIHSYFTSSLLPCSVTWLYCRLTLLYVKLMVVEVADRLKMAYRPPAEPVSGCSSSGVVVKSLAEIKREKVNRAQQHLPADETRSKSSEPTQRSRRDSKIQLYTIRGMSVFLSSLFC